MSTSHSGYLGDQPSRASYLLRYGALYVGKRLKTLEIAREIYEIECRQRVRGQRVMTEWLEAQLIHDTAD